MTQLTESPGAACEAAFAAIRAAHVAAYARAHAAYSAAYAAGREGGQAAAAYQAERAEADEVARKAYASARYAYTEAIAALATSMFGSRGGVPTTEVAGEAARRERTPYEVAADAYDVAVAAYEAEFKAAVAAFEAARDADLARRHPGVSWERAATRDADRTDDIGGLNDAYATRNAARTAAATAWVAAISVKGVLKHAPALRCRVCGTWHHPSAYGSGCCGQRFPRRSDRTPPSNPNLGITTRDIADAKNFLSILWQMGRWSLFFLRLFR